jgi:hypothetical protein
LIPPQIAGSLDPELALFIAKSDRVRFAVFGEVARVGSGVGNESYLFNLIVVDTSDGQVTDLISRPLEPGTEIAVATSIADHITTFIRPGPLLPGGSSGLFISTEPGQVDVFVDGNLVGETPSIGVLMLAEGRYAIEIRRRGFLLESRIVDLEGTGTKFVHVGLSPITGRIIQVDSVPSAEVFLDGKSRGRTPIAFQAQPGDPMVTLVRGGFRTLRVTPPVRNNRVTRLDEGLQPVMDPLVFWPKKQDTLVFFDGEPMLEGFTSKMGGLVMIEVRRGGSVLSKPWRYPSPALIVLTLIR